MGLLTRTVLQTLKNNDHNQSVADRHNTCNALSALNLSNALSANNPQIVPSTNFTRKAMRAKYRSELKILQNAVLEDGRLDSILEQTPLTSEEKTL